MTFVREDNVAKSYYNAGPAGARFATSIIVRFLSYSILAHKSLK